jgi:hypothetical protein
MVSAIINIKGSFGSNAGERFSYITSYLMIINLSIGVIAMTLYLFKKRRLLKGMQVAQKFKNLL